MKPLLPPFAESLLPYKAVMTRRKEAAGELPLSPVLCSCAAADMVSFLSPFVCRRATIIQQGMTKITKVEEDSISKPGILRTGDTGEDSHSYRPVPRTDPVCSGLAWSGLQWTSLSDPNQTSGEPSPPLPFPFCGDRSRSVTPLHTIRWTVSYVWFSVALVSLSCSA